MLLRKTIALKNLLYVAVEAGAWILAGGLLLGA
jgi:hypothetical protein